MQSFKDVCDDELLCLMKHGSEKAFNALYKRYWEKILSIAINKLDSTEEAEEIVQNVMISLWNRRETLVITTSLNNYLATSVRYQIFKALAKRYRERSFKNNYKPCEVDNSTQEELNLQCLKSDINRAVLLLPQKCRLVYTLNKEHGYTYKQIARQLGIADKTVESHMRKALRVLKTNILHMLFSFL